jgi:hypothetical protein
LPKVGQGLAAHQTGRRGRWIHCRCESSASATCRRVARIGARTWMAPARTAIAMVRRRRALRTMVARAGMPSIANATVSLSPWRGAGVKGIATSCGLRSWRETVPRRFFDDGGALA